MTDKKIIIDGVDVYECAYLKYDHIGCDIDQTYCLGNDCSFKQLKRKEQDCEEINLANEKLVNEKYKLNLLINRYQSVLEKIKEVTTCCDENMLCSDCKWDYMCGGELNGLILDIINKVKED